MKRKQHRISRTDSDLLLKLDNKRSRQRYIKIEVAKHYKLSFEEKMRKICHHLKAGKKSIYSFSIKKTEQQATCNGFVSLLTKIEQLGSHESS